MVYTGVPTSASEPGGGSEWSFGAGYAETQLMSAGNPGPTSTVRLTGFGFAVPDFPPNPIGVVLALAVQGRDDQILAPNGGVISDSSIKLVINGGTESASLANGQSVTSPGVQGQGTDATWTYGSATNLWTFTASLTKANINHANFGVDLKVARVSGSTYLKILLPSTSLKIYTQSDLGRSVYMPPYSISER